MQEWKRRCGRSTALTAGFRWTFASFHACVIREEVEAFPWSAAFFFTTWRIKIIFLNKQTCEHCSVLWCLVVMCCHQKCAWWFVWDEIHSLSSSFLYFKYRSCMWSRVKLVVPAVCVCLFGTEPGFMCCFSSSCKVKLPLLVVQPQLLFSCWSHFMFKPLHPTCTVVWCCRSEYHMDLKGCVNKWMCA